jgi:hypothetical protein
LKFGRLTGTADVDPQHAGAQGLKVYIVPTDADGDSLKASGSFVIDAFDLADPAHPTIGHWTFDLEAARKSWVDGTLLYTYALTCPWQQTVPSHNELTIRVTFLDELSQRTFEAQRTVKVRTDEPPKTDSKSKR